MEHKNHSLDEINERVIHCDLCPRLANYITEVGKLKTKRFIGQDYWAKPLPSFGDAKARLLIIGLAPAAHGGNRTGRLFTGDNSGDWVARALYETGFANISTSESKNDGLVLKDVYISTAVRCAPPNNSPTPLEITSCSQYLISELLTLNRTVKVIVTLGKIAFDAYCRIGKLRRLIFGHNIRYDIGNGKTLLASYHPSRQNTNTGKLTWQMWISIFRTAKFMIYK
ncbi:MAG: uracil-DNA glycosylase [Thermoproteota archaeon]|nr:uracil-DNA glycosylase [Thermoproteota archaeon]